MDNWEFKLYDLAQIGTPRFPRWPLLSCNAHFWASVLRSSVGTSPSQGGGPHEPAEASGKMVDCHFLQGRLKRPHSSGRDRYRDCDFYMRARARAPRIPRISRRAAPYPSQSRSGGSWPPPFFPRNVADREASARGFKCASQPRLIWHLAM